MQSINNKKPALAVALIFLASCAATVPNTQDANDAFTPDETAACQALRLLPNLTITHAGVAERYMGVPSHCYVRGLISGSIGWHAQLPAKALWTGRLVHQGDGGSDGKLDYKPDPYTRSWVSEGDAVVNSNSGHDSGTGPNWAYENRQAEIDFAYRAVHLTTQAGKTLVDAYYGRRPDYSYHVGCSNGGRQGLVAAQRFPGDFDGIVAGAPSIFRAENFYHQLQLMQLVFADGMAANPAIDTDDDGIPDSLVNIETLHEAVLEQCDDMDGIADGVIDNPRACDFDAAAYLARHRCPDESPAAGCFTPGQADFILRLYQGSRDNDGKPIYGGLQPGSEITWHRYIPTAQNRLRPYALRSLQRTHQLVFDADPPLPAWEWRAQDPDAILQESGELQEIMDARGADLRPYLVERGGKLLLYQGWDEPFHSADQLIEYYEAVVQTTFSGNEDSAASSLKLFMLPGVQHCILGSGPDRWDSYGVMKDWVEKARVPGQIIVHHKTWDVTDNDRPVCAYPEQAIYTGPEGGATDPANWVAGNFTCP
ncbi:MAG: tannase/feruloyl esterase family alpha/beta hydrolase [Woeseiaceae bacterium]